MPAVLSGVTAAITSAVAVRAVISATLTSSSARRVIAVIRQVSVRRMIVVTLITTPFFSTGVSKFLDRCRIQRALVTASIIFVSARTRTFSGNLIANFHGIIGCCTSCYMFEVRGATTITLPVTKQHRLQRFVLLIRECPEECVSLMSGGCDVIKRSEAEKNEAQLLDYSIRIVLVSRGHLEIDELVVQLLRSRLTIESVVGLKCHRSTTTFANFRCSYRSVC